MLFSILAGPVAIGLIFFSVIVLKLRGSYTELLAGLWFVFIMSDNRASGLSSFEQSKYVYTVLLAFFLFFDNKNFKPFSKFYLRFLPFMLIAFYCLFHSPTSIFLQAFSKTLSYFFLLLLVPNYLSKSYRENGTDLLRLLIYVAIFILLMGLVFKVFIPSYVTLEQRYRGMLGNPNGLGLFCLIVFIFFVLINKSFAQLFNRNEKIVFYGLIFLSILLSGSRNALFAVMIFLLFSAFTRISAVFGFVMLILLLMGYEYINVNILTIVKSLGLQSYLRAETLSNAAGRYVAWKLAWDNISKDIFLGHGFEYTNNLFKTNQQALNDLGHQGNAHNSYLTFWLDTGLLGLLAFLWGFVGNFIRAAKRNKLAMAALYAILFSAVFESYLTASLNPYTIVIVMLLTILTSDEILPIQAEAIIPLH